MRRILSTALLLGVLTPLGAAQPPFELSVDSIMRGPKLVGYPPSSLRWSGDSTRLYFEWRERDADEPSTWVVERACRTAPPCTPRKLTDEERKNAPPAAGLWDRHRRRALGVQDGDIVLFDTVAGTRTAVTRTTGAESNPRWARDETHVAFTRDNSLYLVGLGASGGGLQQLTDAGPPRRDPPLTDSQKFLKGEEQELLEYVRDAEARRKKREERRDKEALPRLELTERQSAQDLQLARDGRYVYAIVIERARDAKRADVPNYVTSSGYAEQIPARAKVGDAQDRRRLAILNLETKKQVWATLDLPEPAEPAPPPPTTPRGGPREPQTAEERAGAGAGPQDRDPEAKAKADPSRELRWGMPVLSRDGRHAVAMVLSADGEHRWFARVDPETGKARVLDHLEDKAWVRVAGGFGPSGGGGAGFLPDDRRFWFLSERDGWMHLYTVDVTEPSPSPRQLTTGRWEVSSVELSPDERQFLLVTSEAHPGERHAYTMPLDGGARTRLTEGTGAYAAEPSPDGRTLALLHSTGNRPPEVFLSAGEPGARRANRSCGVDPSRPSQKGQRSRSASRRTCGLTCDSASGRAARSGAMTTHRPVTGSRRYSGDLSVLDMASPRRRLRLAAARQGPHAGEQPPQKAQARSRPLRVRTVPPQNRVVQPLHNRVGRVVEPVLPLDRVPVVGVSDVVHQRPRRAALPQAKCVAQGGKVARRRRNLGAAGRSWAKCGPSALQNPPSPGPFPPAKKEESA